MTDSDHTRWKDDLAAYMLGALEPGEAAELERHLEGCERCQEEMRWLEPALHSLPESVERREPPKQLRQSLMAEVRADARGEQTARSSWWRGLWTTRSLRVATGFALVALAVAGVVGYEVGRDGSGGEAATTVVRQVDGMTVKMVREGESGTLHLSGVPRIPSDKVLEAWVEREGEVEAVPALFVPDRHGQAETRIADMTGVETVMVTEEPQGGSETPTGAPLMTMSVPG